MLCPADLTPSTHFLRFVQSSECEWIAVLRVTRGTHQFSLDFLSKWLEIRCTGNGTVGSNPTHSASKRAHPTGWALLLFFVVGGIRKAALSGMPVACRNRRGFSAEKESHPHYQITGFSRSSGRGISYYRWGSKFILRSSKSHPLRQRAPLCTHSSFPKTFVTALTLRIGKKRSYYQITAVFHISGGRGSNLYEIEKPRRLVSVSSAFFRFF